MKWKGINGGNENPMWEWGGLGPHMPALTFLGGFVEITRLVHLQVVLGTFLEEDKEMDNEVVLIKQIHETEDIIANTLSRCEKMVDNELVELSSMTKRSSEDLFKSVASRVVDKLLSLLHQQPTALLGVEEAVEWIEREVRAAEASGRGSLEYVIATDDDPLRKQLSGLPAPDHTELCPLDSPQDTEETASPDMNSAESEHVKHGGLSHHRGSYSSACSQKALHPKMKKAARRNRTNSVDVMEELINKREQLRRSWVEPLGRVVFDFHNFKSQHMLAMEIDKIYSKILNISTRKREEVPGNSQSTVPAANAFPIQPLLRYEMHGGESCIQVIEKLSVLLVRDPWAVVGVEDQLQWVEGELKRAGAHYELAEELIDVAYDVEDVIVVQCSLDPPQDIEEIDWSQRSSAFDQKISNTVVSPVIKKVTALLDQGALPTRVKKSARQVQDKFRLMNDFLRDLESVELDNRWRVWIDELCQVCHSTEDVIDQFLNSREQIGRSWSGALRRGVLGFGHLIAQHKLVMKMDQISAQILDLSSRRPERAHGHSPNDTSFSVISIVGMPGIGKTTLAKLIYNNKAVVDHFPFRAWTSATHEHKFFRDIMGEHTNYRERTRGGKRFIIVPDDAEMAHKLNAFLTGKRYLIVLDDASSTNFLNRMVKAFPDASNGSRMILISRSRSLPSELERRSVHHAVRLRGNDEKLDIVHSCFEANMLSQKGLTIEEWSNALQQLNRDQEQFWSYPLSRISKDLPLYMRQCLFYFGLFPQDFEIPARRLTALWVAEGLVQAKGEDEAPEDAAERCLIQLIAEGMVRVTKKKRNGNIKTCCLPGALQQCWLSKALNATFLQIHTKTTSHLSPSTGMIRRLTDHLDKEDITFDHIHGALGNLTRLRYLGLRSTFLDMLPSFIKKLENLQVLDLKHTNIITLPSPIWNMQRLRRLYLNERCHCQSVPQPRVGSFSTLQVLVGLFVDEEAPVKDGLDRFVNLQKLGLKCRLLSSQQEAMAEWVLKSKHLRSLSLKSIDEQNQVGDLDLKPLTGHVSLSCLYLLGRLKNPSIVSEFPHGLIDLTLSGSELKEDPMETLDKLPNLKILSLLAKSYTGNNMRCSLGGFSQLRVLKLWILEQLEEWNVEEGALQALRALDIRGCMRLKMLPEALHHRALLQVKLTDMPSDFA
ncbi:putative disease resistance protein [Vitis vinifera]|uniref:Putative disease resistance protein n=1 Tax=Vitis vinifera TaxID=29760 RepID=A0A438DFN7_VITVI|nr:putative disease resistance protein [Vitis vinifera]